MKAQVYVIYDPEKGEYLTKQGFWSTEFSKCRIFNKQGHATLSHKHNCRYRTKSFTIPIDIEIDDGLLMKKSLQSR